MVCMRDKAWSHVGRFRSISTVRGDALTTADRTPSRYAALGKIESELVGLLRKAVTRDCMRRLRFVVHAADWLHSMVLHAHG